MLLERYNLHKRRQRIDETVEEFANEISQLAMHCLFDSQEEYMIRDYVVFGLRDQKIAMSIVEKGGNPSLTDVIDICKQFQKKIKIQSSASRPDRKRNVVNIKSSTAAIDCTSKVFIKQPKNKPPEKKPPEKKPPNTEPPKTDKPFQCPHCDKIYAIEREFNMHLNAYKGRCRFMCKMCGNLFMNDVYLETHMKIHSNTKHACKQCEFTSKTEGNLQLHIKTVHFEEACPICKKRFSKQYLLNAHVKQVHPETTPDYQKRDYECHLCHRSFKTEYTLRGHFITIHMRKTQARFLCAQCGQRFISNHQLKLHLMRDDHNQSGQSSKPYKCEHCDKGFTTFYRMKEHITVHTKEKPYTCEVCNKRFACRSNLGQHRFVHTNEKKYQCQLCDYKCYNTGNMKKHMKVHTGRQ